MSLQSFWLVVGGVAGIIGIIGFGVGTSLGQQLAEVAVLVLVVAACASVVGASAGGSSR